VYGVLGLLSTTKKDGAEEERLIVKTRWIRMWIKNRKMWKSGKQT
jgi:hypothetical protein